jgi:hypothetical protein
MYRRLALMRPVLAAYADVDLGARQEDAFARLGVSSAELRALRDLFDAIEPVKWYARLLGEAALHARVAGSTAAVERPYSVATPLNRVVDYLDPASEWVPRFNAAVRAIFNGSADAADRRLVVEGAAGWRRQRDVVRLVGERVPAIAELSAISTHLARLADVVDAALTGSVAQSHRMILSEAKPAMNELIIAVTPVLDEWLRP